MLLLFNKAVEHSSVSAEVKRIVLFVCFSDVIAGDVGLTDDANFAAPGVVKRCAVAVKGVDEPMHGSLAQAPSVLEVTECTRTRKQSIC